MKRLTVYCLILLQYASNAQHPVTDSLEKILLVSHKDTSRVNVLNTLAVQYSSSNKSKSRSLAAEALQLSKKLKYYKGAGIACAVEARHFNYEDNPAEAVIKFADAKKYFVKARDKQRHLAILREKTKAERLLGNFDAMYNDYREMDSLARRIMDTLYIIRALHGLANVYRYRDEYTTSLDYYIRTVKLANLSKHKDEEAVALANMAKIYMYLNRPDDERKVLERSAELMVELGDSLQIIGAYSNLINHHLNYKNFPEAEKICEKTKALVETYGEHRISHEHLCDFYRNLALLYFSKKQYTQAEMYYKKGLESAIIDGSKKNIARVWGDLAETYLTTSNYKQAENCAYELLNLSQEIGHKRGQMLAFKYLADTYFALANYKKAFENHKRYSQVRDSLLTEENMKQMNEMHEKYESGKKEQQIKMLHKEKEIMDAVTNADNRRKNAILVSVSAGLFLCLGFIWFALRSLRTTRSQKKIIESKQKEILDSINYAKRLQQAILAPPGEIKKYLPDSFLMYRPKDIVAGDFYFFETTDTHIFIAAADCTGHGVPGAMVSIVCSNALTRCVKEFSLSDPGKILKAASELVTQTFEKSGDDVKDGMDISLVCIHIATGEIKWAGANNALWYLVNGELNEVAPTKRSVGRSENKTEFVSHTLPVIKGASLFLYTDGFADQFGGPRGKKFKYTRLQQTLLAHYHLPMEAFQQQLHNVFDTWKGDLEQVDDVCIISIRI